MTFFTTLIELYVKKIGYVLAVVLGIGLWGGGARWITNSLLSVFGLSDDFEPIILGACFFAIPFAGYWLVDRYDNWRVGRKLKYILDAEDQWKKDEMHPLSQALKLAAVETERANKLFPDDEQRAVYELGRRANELPDLKKALLFMCALNLVRGAQMPGGSSDWINAEVGRVKNLHSDEAEAVIELLHRSRGFPDQRMRMIAMTAVNTIAVSRLPPE